MVTMTQKPAPDDLENRTFTPLGEAANDSPQSAPGADAPPDMTDAQAITAALALSRAVFVAVTDLNAIQSALTDADLQKLGQVWAPVAQKYGLNLADFMGAYKVEITAIVVTSLIGQKVYKAVALEIAARRAAEKIAEPQETPSSDGGQDSGPGAAFVVSGTGNFDPPGNAS